MRKALFVLVLAMGLTSSAYANLIITEVVEGTAGSFKYVEIHNSSLSPFTFAAGDLLRRYVNGVNAVNGTIALTGTIPAQGFIVIANNMADYQTVFGVSANATAYTTNISHNGNDAYDLFVGGVIVDQFTRDLCAGTDYGAAPSPAGDGTYFRVMSVYPNNGNWGPTVPAAPLIADGATCPSGFWKRGAFTASNGGASTKCTPFAAGGGGGTEVAVKLSKFSVE